MQVHRFVYNKYVYLLITNTFYYEVNNIHDYTLTFITWSSRRLFQLTLSACWAAGIECFTQWEAISWTRFY